jgi:hypothetical protein
MDAWDGMHTSVCVLLAVHRLSTWYLSCIGTTSCWWVGGWVTHVVYLGATSCNEAMMAVSSLG